ncbi:MAG: response regulator [Planctomycetota bacterium]|nr:MAG: response regulator [Planctomycetota bacterium]
MAAVLIVEDNLVNQKLMQAIVSGAGYTTHVVANGRLAVEFLADHTVDLVFMDLMMPVMDGFEASRRIRQELGLRNLPIIAVTANTLVGSRERALESGCDDYIAKPYTKQQLLGTLNQWIRGSSDQFHPV